LAAAWPAPAAGLAAGWAAGAPAGALVAAGAAGGAGGAQANTRLVSTVNEMAVVDTPQPGQRGGEVRPLIVVLRIPYVSPSPPIGSQADQQ
jgi:hypothetical protein